MNENFATGLGMFLLRAGILLACFWAAFGCLRSNPRARVMLCRVVSVAVILLPLVGFLPVPAVLNLPAVRHPAIETPLPPPAPVVPVEAPLPRAQDNTIPVHAGASAPAAVPVQPPPQATPRPWKFPQFSVPNLLVTTWSAGVFLLMAGWVVGFLLARRLAASAQTVPEWVHEAAARLCAQMGIRGKVDIGAVGETCSPLLIGPGHLILLPRHLVSEGGTDDAHAALAHELVHIKQRDWHWSQWLHFVTILSWPLPPAWFLRRAHDAASELVCDRVAAESAGGAEAYAGSLARQSLQAIGNPRLATVPMLRKSGIRRRIDLLLSGVALPSLSQRAILCTALLALLAAGLLGGLQLARAANNQSKKENAAAADARIKKEVETFTTRLDKKSDLKLGPEQCAEIIRGIRADLEKVPQPEQAWIALWLDDGSQKHMLKLPLDLWYHNDPLYSQDELLDICRQVDPETWMTVLKEERLPGDDPAHRNFRYSSAFRFILYHADVLLRPQDAEALIKLNSGKDASPWWLIAAAKVQPAKAVEILQPAFAEFPDADRQLELCTALWQACGESQAAFIVDKFYGFAAAKPDFPGSAGPEYTFISDIAWIKNPPARRLIAAILQDKRLDVLGTNSTNAWTLVQIVRAVNGWSGKPVVSDAEIGKALSGKETTDANLQMRKELLDRMRDSVPQWVNAANEAPAPEPSPAQHLDLEKEFEKFAGESAYFEINDVLYRQEPYISGATAEENAKYTAFIKHFLSIHATKDQLIPLLKQPTDYPPGPKIRTLVIAALATLDDPAVLPAIADFLPDGSPTFSRREMQAQRAQTGPPHPKTDVTVGENAQEALFYWLDPAGYTGYQFLGRREESQKSRKEFDEYWSKHKYRAYCASWFAVRMKKMRSTPVMQGTTPIFPDQSAEIKRSVRADLEKVPEPDKTWIALWLNHESPGALYSQAELLEMCRKLGPDALMGALKQQRSVSDDPDIQHGNSGTRSDFTALAQFILQNAGALLRPEDSAALVNFGGSAYSSPLWFVAAAQLQPAKAVEILRGAMEKLPGDPTLAAALWKTGGESQAGFLADQFYAVALNGDVMRNGWGGEFIDAVSPEENPPARKLFAAILQDKRLDDLKLDWRTFRSLAKRINSWAPQPVVSDEEINKATEGEGGKGGNPGPLHLELKMTLLHRMRDSAPQWNN